MLPPNFAASIWKQRTIGQTRFLGTYLRDHVEIGDERRLQDDRDVAGVEELDGVRAVLSTVARALDRKVDAEALKDTNKVA